MSRRYLTIGKTPAVYDGCGEISVITATKKTEVLAVPADAVSFLIDTNREFRQRYILFLTSRIRFLNDRIRSYVSQGATSRLAQHLLLCDEDQSGNIELPCPASKLADMLGVGRASLYRAFDTLTGSGIIDRKGRKIMILDHCKLRSFADGAQEKASDRKKALKAIMPYSFPVQVRKMSCTADNRLLTVTFSGYLDNPS